KLERRERGQMQPRGEPPDDAACLSGRTGLLIQHRDQREERGALEESGEPNRRDRDVGLGAYPPRHLPITPQQLHGRRSWGWRVTRASGSSKSSWGCTSGRISTAAIDPFAALCRVL